MKFLPKRQKLPKDAVRIPVLEEARKGRGYFAPYSDWEADTPASKPEKSGDWTFTGKRGMAGWTFAYRGGRLACVTAPSGRTIDFQYKIVGQEHGHEYHLRCVDVGVDVMVEVRLYFKSDDEENPVIDTWGYELALQTLSCSIEKPFLQE